MLKTHNHHYSLPLVVIHPGEFYSSRNDEIISTVLGSCISVVLHDPVLGYSGMNHFMLPGKFDAHGPITEESGRYGMFAMELLINDMLKKGSRKENLEAKVFGGGHVLASIPMPPQRPGRNALSAEELFAGIGPASVPVSNIEFARAYLSEERIPVVAEDTGGVWGRKIMVFTTSSKVLLKRFQGQMVAKAASEEIEYLAKLKAERKAGNVTLF